MSISHKCGQNINSFYYEKLIKLKLNQLCNSELKKREMNTIKRWQMLRMWLRGISSDWDNGNANVAHGYEPADGMGGMGGSM